MIGFRNFFLVFILILGLNSCDPKAIGGGSSDCDTIVKIRIDTIFKVDTVFVEKIKYINDTIYVRDTIYKTVIDTLYIDKPVFIYDTIFKPDTIYKTVIERDTINIIKVDTLRITDTIIRTEFVQKWDTVFVPKIDTVEVIKPLPKTTIDTLVWGWARIKMNKPKQVQFTYRIDSLNFETFNLKTIDTTIYKCGISTDILKDTVQFNIRKFYEGNYFIKAEEIEKPVDTTFRIVESVLRSYDSSGMTIQTYATEDWIFNHKSADTYNEITGKCENWQSEWNRFPEYTAGQAFNYQTPDGVIHAELYRHTGSSEMLDKKCHKIGVENRLTGEILESKVHVNPDM